MNEKNHTLFELIVGILVLGGVVQVILLFVLKDELYHAIGLWSGVVIALFMAVHMYVTIQKQLEMDEDSAGKYARNQAMLRRFVVMAGLILVACFRLGNVLTMLAGVFTLKFAAYLQPITHKVLRYLYQKT